MKKFLVVFKLPQPRLEHAQLKKDLEAYSRGNCQLAFSWVDADKAGLIGYVFTTDAHLADLTFDGHLFREDGYLLLELGQQAAGERFSDVLDWLRTYRSL